MESGTFWGTVVWTRSAIGICDFAEENWSGRRGSNPQLPAWEFELPLLYFHNLQNRLAKSYMHAVHTVHALPDLRIAAGRLRDVSPPKISIISEVVLRRSRTRF